MKKMITTISLILILMTRLTAPATSYCYITAGEPVYIYGVKDSFLRAVISFESDFRADAVNPISKARGILQILPVMIREVNKYGYHYTWNDAFNPYKSIEMWWIIQDFKNPDYYPDKACRLWFGIGTQYDGMTWESYYMKVIR